MDKPVGVPSFHESVATIGRGPITPPISPDDSEGSTASAMALDKGEFTTYPPEPVERPSLLIQTSTPLWQQPHGSVMAPQPRSPPRRPERLLEDEAVHVERRGVLRLLDFEVKGALGL